MVTKKIKREKMVSTPVMEDKEHVLSPLVTPLSQYQQKYYAVTVPHKQYCERGFSLRWGESKSLPSNPSQQLLDRISSGFIKEVSPDVSNT